MVEKIGDEGGDCSLADEQRCKIPVPIQNPLQILHKSMKNYLKLKMLVVPFCPKKRSRRKGITAAFSIAFNLWYVSFTNPSPLSKLSPNFSSQTALKFSPLSSDFIFKLKAQILEAIGVDYVDESEVFVCGFRNLGEALRRIREGAAMFLRFRSILLSSWFR